VAQERGVLILAHHAMDAPVIGQLTSPSARYQSQRQQTVVHLARLQGKLGPRDGAPL
jgi:hypothetical protein